jgi:subtilase family serine protease
VAAACAVVATNASAYPVVKGAPRVDTHFTQPPTTADCQAAFAINCYSPLQIEQAYNMPALYAQHDQGQGRTIAIVDSFGSPTIKQDLQQFDSDFGLPDPQLKIIQPAGAVPPFDGSNSDMVNWAVETSLDVEYAHAMAPKAKILLVETPVSETEGVTGLPEMMAAENYVIDHHMADVISQSFGATENTFPSAQSIFRLRSAFFNAARNGVTVLGASGDLGSTDYKLNLTDIYRHRVNSWPSSDPLVTSVGGTQLHLDADGNRTAPDNVWNDIPEGIDAAGGGGPSHVFAKPLYQYLVHTGSGQRRATPDISLSAAVDGGVLVYGSFPGLGGAGYLIVGGTSEATPLFSGVVAIAAQLAGHGLGLINPQMYLQDLRGGAGIIDITLGNNTFTLLDDSGNPVFTVPGFQAKPGYDMASGLGTVDGFRFAHAMAHR